ncbi:MAG TPA: PilZ domain-containing protein [Gemmatimonadales bacterium]|nr:PilZ domain-containing protein [Gemmatimonadales bacterium]
MTDPARRIHPRLSFSGRPAPRLETADRSYEIVDLSQGGLRLRASGMAPAMTIGEVLRAVIRFPADRAVEVRGRVLRISGSEAAVELEQGQERLAATRPMGPAVPRRSGLLW